MTSQIQSRLILRIIARIMIRVRITVASRPKIRYISQAGRSRDWLKTGRAPTSRGGEEVGAGFIIGWVEISGGDAAGTGVGDTVTVTVGIDDDKTGNVGSSVAPFDAGPVVKTPVALQALWVLPLKALTFQ